MAFPFSFNYLSHHHTRVVIIILIVDTITVPYSLLLVLSLVGVRVPQIRFANQQSSGRRVGGEEAWKWFPERQTQ